MHLTASYSLDILPVQVFDRAALRRAAENISSIPALAPTVTSVGLTIPGVRFLTPRPITSKTIFTEGAISDATNTLRVVFATGGKKKLRINRPTGYQVLTVSTALIKAITTISWSRYLRRKHGNKLGYGPEQDAIAKIQSLLDYPDWSDSVPFSMYDMTRDEFLLERGSYHGLTESRSLSQGEVYPLYVEAEADARVALSIPAEASSSAVVSAIADRVGAGTFLSENSHAWYSPTNVHTRTLGVGQFTPVNQETMQLALGSFSVLIEALNGPATSTFQTAGYALSLADTFGRLGLHELTYDNPSVEDYCPTGCSPRAWKYLCAGTASAKSADAGAWSSQPLLLWPDNLLQHLTSSGQSSYSHPLTAADISALRTVPMSIRQRIADVMDLIVDLHSTDPSDPNRISFDDDVFTIKTMHPITKGVSIPCGSPVNPIISVA